MSAAGYPYVVATPPPDTGVRACASVRDVAAMLACHQSQVRRLIASGEIEGFVIGRRGVRAYIDSVAAYQARHTIAVAAPDRQIERSRRRVANAADAAAQRRLREMGFLA